MANVSYRLDDLKKAIVGIGYVGENDHMHVLIDCKEVFDEYPNAVPTMAIVPPVGEGYPKTVTRNGDVVEWLVKNSDVTKEGDGEFQITFTEGAVIKKSVNGRFRVIRSISGSGEAPSGIDDWLTEANETLAEAEEATRDAEAAASHQPYIGIDGYWYTWNGAEFVKNVKAQGEKGDPGDPGSPGDPTQLIDDTAGEGQTEKTWSADKLDGEFTDVLTAIQGIGIDTGYEKILYPSSVNDIVQSPGNNKSIRTKELYSVKKNQRIVFIPGTNVKRFELFIFDKTTETQLYDFGYYFEGTEPQPFDNDYKIRLAFVRSAEDDANLTPQQYDAVLEIADENSLYTNVEVTSAQTLYKASKTEICEIGTLDAGYNYASTTRIRTIKFGNEIISADAVNGFEFMVYAWDNNGTFKGAYTRAGKFTLSGTTYWTKHFIFSIYEGYSFRLVLRNGNNTSQQLSISDANNLLFNTSMPVNNNKKIDNVVKMLGVPEKIKNTIPDTAVNYHHLWDSLVEAGYVSRSAATYVNNNQAYPLYTYSISVHHKYMNPDYSVANGLPYQRKKVLVISGQHGDEIITPYALVKFVERMFKNPGYKDILTMFDWEIIPLVNPTGYNARTRNNYQDININRDYDDSEGFVTTEAQYVRDVFLAGNFDLALDFHQDPDDGKTSGDNRCGFVSMHAKREFDTQDDYDALKKAFCEAVTAAGSRTDASMCIESSATDENVQTNFIWQSTSNSAKYFRNYVAGEGGNTQHTDHYVKLSMTFETSTVCYYYAKVATPYTDPVIRYTNLYMDEIIKALFSLFK